MTTTTFEIHISQPLLQFGFNQSKIQQQVEEWLVLSLFTDGRVSSGKAAQLLGMNRLDFIELLHRRGIAFIDYTIEELAQEFAGVYKL
jgi:predicted HTH domain antitoxin